MNKKKLFISMITIMAVILSSFSLPAAVSAKSFTLNTLKGKSFSFSSGAGGWSTDITFRSNGTFSGQYHDSEYKEVYLCNFSGKFGKLKKVNKYVYSARLVNIKIKNKKKTVKKNGLKYIYTTSPYGLEKGKNFYFYLPGVSCAKLPKDFKNWVFFGKVPKKLTFYGLYNINEKTGFRGDDAASK